jgi:hypothetical protein
MTRGKRGQADRACLSAVEGSVRPTITAMGFPIKVCAVCAEEFELKPGKPGFANRCPACSEPENADPAPKRTVDKEANEARRTAMRNLLYRKDS